MKKKTFISLIFVAVATLLNACTHDDTTDPSDGLYPLQIGTVTITAYVSDGAETDNGSNVFKSGDAISVSLNGETAMYTYDGSSWTPDTQLYWTDTDETLTAWYTTPDYTNDDGTVNLSNQTNGLAYVLRTTAGFNETVDLVFTHQLAKVRVMTKGTYDTSASTITLTASTECTVNEGTISATSDNGTITMYQTSYYGIGTCWEASVPGGTVISSVTMDDTEYSLDAAVTTEEGSLHTLITLTVHQEGTTVVDLSELTDTYCIYDSGIYYFTGKGSYPIYIYDCSPDIYLDNVTIMITSDDTGIRTIYGYVSTTTIHVSGENEITSTQGSGIYVAYGSSVTIEGNSRNDVLTLKSDSFIGLGIWNSNVTIRNLTVYSSSGFAYPGIGGLYNITIMIEEATVYAYGAASEYYSYYAPAIGALGDLPTITISDSEIYAYRGGYNETSYSDWIGTGLYFNDYEGGTIQGTIKNTTVYKYMRDYATDEYIDEGVVYYDENGNVTTVQ